jgi:DNA invertase Pin-like site-specific DNA recombinase
MLAVFAEFETNLRRERQLEGIARGKGNGVYKGGKPRIDRQAVIRLKEDGKGPTEIARELKISRMHVYRVLAMTRVRVEHMLSTPVMGSEEMGDRDGDQKA